mmetsp:Transcript_16708/g.23318  ORF Transcript_16708/g.23318 Transcript_16708/m.23318 type:complete len:780 (+) Transcript_16708:69-2408(+)
MYMMSGLDGMVRRRCGHGVAVDAKAARCLVWLIVLAMTVVALVHTPSLLASGSRGGATGNTQMKNQVLSHLGRQQLAAPQRSSSPLMTRLNARLDCAESSPRRRGRTKVRVSVTTEEKESTPASAKVKSSGSRSRKDIDKILDSLPPSSTVIPDSVKPVTVKLNDGEGKEVFLIGISHVSQRSVEQSEELIEAVKPDVVMLELCLARSALLVREDDTFDSANDERAFYLGGKARIVGMPTGPGFPTEEEVLEWAGFNALKDGQPLTRPNFDQLVQNLLSTGLFSSVRIQAEKPAPSAVPLYMSRRRIFHKILPSRTYIPWQLDEDDPKDLYPVYPLGDLVFNCTERTGMLATIEKVEVRGDVPRELGGSGVLEEKILKWFKETKSTLRTLMLARKEILALQPDSKIEFLGGDSRRIVVSIVDYAKSNSKVSGSNTGMEATVYDGRGSGIMPTTVPGYTIPKVPGAEGESTWRSNRGLKWNAWSEVDKRMAPDSLTDYLKNPVAAKLGEFLISRFGKFQDKAGRKARIKPGEAWQTAFTAAVNNGAKMVVLGDELALKTQAEITKKLFERLATWWAVGALTAAAGVMLQFGPEHFTSLASAVERVPMENLHLYVYALAAAQVAGVAVNLYSPIRKMQTFARQRGSTIEDKLQIRTPLELATEETLLEGEDAILEWPMAKEIVLDTRNRFMADTLFRMVRNKPARCPAYVTFENTETKDVLQRFLMGPGETEDTNPRGVGLGTYETPEVRKVVAVVGTAHIHGIREEFERLKRADAAAGGQ